MLLVHEVNSIDQLDRYTEDWQRLLAVTPDATFFQTLDWLKIYWQHYGHDQQLRVLIVGNPDRPTGIVPLVVRREKRKVGSVRVLTYPLDDWGSFYGPITDRGVDVLHASLDHLKNTRQEWDLLDLRWAPTSDIDPTCTDQVLKLVDLSARCELRAETSVIDLIGSWEQYLSSRTSKWRNNFKRWQRRLDESGEVTHQRYRPAGIEASDAEPRWDLFEECLRLAEISWQGSSTSGTTLSHESVRDFLRDVHQVAVNCGCLDLNLLRVDGKAVAFAYNYCFNGYVYGLRIGYDPALSKLSPGNVLYGKMIEDSFARGDRIYDMGPGSLSIKRHLWTRVEPVLQYTHYRAFAWNAQLLRLKGQLQDWWQDRTQAVESQRTEAVLTSH